MAAKINEEVKQKAVDLRRQGKTYAEVSDVLEGAVSVDWCKRNLKDVEKDQDLQWVVEQRVLEKAKSDYGCTNRDIVFVIQDVKGKLCVNEDDMIDEHMEVSDIKRRLRAKDDENVFRPEIVHQETPRFACDLLREYSSELHDILMQFSDRFNLNVFGSESALNSNYVIYELLSLAYPRFSKWGVEQRCEYLYSVVEKLEERKRKKNAINEIQKG